MSLLCYGLILRRFVFFVSSSKLFSRVVALKLVFQDFPQQICVAAYLYAWYSDNGLRCQMCLFHPRLCEEEHPLHFANMMLCVSLMVSAATNQLLLQAKAKAYGYDEEDECFICCARLGMFSVSILPFATAILFLSGPLLHLRSVVVYCIFAVPTVMGWGALVCVPMMSCCDDDF